MKEIFAGQNRTIRIIVELTSPIGPGMVQTKIFKTDTLIEKKS
jgi:hypothetical protein